jgi:hypothetical protein
MKIMAIVDRHGLPLSVSTHAANHHEVRLVQLCFDFYMIEAKPENLIGDRERAISDRQHARLLLVRAHNYLKCAEEREAQQLSAR